MRRHAATALPVFALLIAAAALCGCSRSVGQAHAQQDPGALARALVAAVQAGDEAAFQELLTVKARQGVQSGSGFDIGEGRLGNARIGEASVTGDSVQFHYLDARGKDLENSIHTVSAPMAPGNLAPVVHAGARVRNEATAFFMPDATRNLRIEVDAVGFMDGTTWSATP